MASRLAAALYIKFTTCLVNIGARNSVMVIANTITYLIMLCQFLHGVGTACSQVLMTTCVQ
jgi:hypothetical protein